MKTVFKFTFGAAFAFIILAFVSCSSAEDELVGSWSTSFGLSNDYQHLRVAQKEDDHNTFMQTFTFEMGEKNEPGKFKDYIAPLAMLTSSSDDEIIVGSVLTGTWELKNKKLYLHFNNLELVNADNLAPELKNAIKDEMQKRFFEKYQKDAENGISYEIEERNNKTGLILNFGSTKLKLIKSEKKENK